MATDKRPEPTREDAEKVAKTIGCRGVHEHEGKWYPCASQEALAEVSNRAEDDSWLRTIGEKGAVSVSGRKRRKRVNRTRNWENLRERTYGVESVPGVGLVSGSPATAFSGGDSGKGVMPFSPEVGDPEVYTSPDAARMRSNQIGCTGIRRYTTRSGRQVWMPCTTGVTYDKLTGQGAFRGRNDRIQNQRIERIVRREVRRASAFNGSKKDARSRKLSATPAKPSERIKGSDRNREGSSSSVSSASGIQLSQEQVRALATKAREHNARMREENKPSWAMTSTNALKAVMRRGMGAFSSSHRPNVNSRQQWGMARVNAFLVMLDNGRPKNPKYTTDNDLLRDGHPWKKGRSTGGTKSDPLDRDGDGYVNDGKPTQRFVGFRRVVDAATELGERASDALAARRRGGKPIRVNLSETEGGKPKGRAKRVVKEMEDTIAKLKKGEPEKPSKGFKPTGRQVPERLSKKRLSSLTPSRNSHSRLVQTQREYEKAPKPEGEHKAASVDELLRPDGSIGSTHDHFGIGEGEITPERKALHEAIIKSVVFGNGKWEPKKSETPMAWMMGGGPASGKTFLRQGGFFDTPKRGDTVHLDADEIKEMLPEFDALREELKARGMDITAAAAAVHAESTYLQREAMKLATENGFNVVVDSTGDGGPKAFARRMDILKDAGYKIKGRVADVSIGKAGKEAEKRKKEQGRGVPVSVVIDTHIDVARAVLYALQEGIYDDFELVDNEDHSNPVTIAAMKDGELVIHDKETWTQFIDKAALRSQETYEDGGYFGEAMRAGTKESAREMARKRIKARKVRTKRIEGVDSIVAEPVPFLAEKLPKTEVDYKKVVAVPKAKREEMTKVYESLPEFSEEAREAYEALTEEISQQFRMLTEELGIKVEFVDDDPYGDPLEMMDDLQTNKRLKVLKTETTGPHPYWTNEENDMFRAVHDAFGHAATGRGFDRHGEEAAYQAHSSMVSELARRALLTETRGQNVVVITTGDFPPQKMALLPEIYIKADAQGLPQIQPMQTAQQDVSPPSAEGDFPITADEDNLYSLGRCHHTTGGRRMDRSSTVVETAGLFDDAGEDPALPPETRAKIHEAVALGRTIEDSDVDETNKDIRKYYARIKKDVRSLGKGTVVDLPTSAVDAVLDR